MEDVDDDEYTHVEVADCSTNTSSVTMDPEVRKLVTRRKCS